MAVDYGLARLGVALSDPTRTLASPLTVLHEKDKGAQINRVVDLAREHGVGRILVGVPVHMDGTNSDMSVMAEKYAAKLERVSGLPVERVDERLTSAAAEELLLDNMRQGRTRRRALKGEIDKVAATLMLQEWLDAQG